MYTTHSYFNLIQQITERENKIQRMLNPASSVIEIQNQILHTFSPTNFYHVNIANEAFNNSPAAFIEQTIRNSPAAAIEQAINNISRPEISLFTQPISIMNSIYAQTQAIQNITDIYNVVPQMLPFLDIPVLNSYIQNICSNIPNDVLIDFNETELNIIDKIQPLIEAFNKNIYTKIKIKILDNKQKIGNLVVFILLVMLLKNWGYDVKENLNQLINNFLPNLAIYLLTKTNSK